LKSSRIVALFLVSVLFIYPVSCTMKRQTAPPKQGEQEQNKGYIIYINIDTPQKYVMYQNDAGGKKKGKVYDKNPESAAGYGEKIAFTSKESGKQVLYTINADGSSLTPVLNNFNIKENSISWSPDGRRIAFIARQTGDLSEEIYYVEAGKNKTPVKVTEDVYNDESPRFSSDGKILYYSKIKDNNSDIYRYDLAGQSSSNISNNISNDISPVVSPDGTKILFLSDEKEKGKYNLFIMGTQDGVRSELTTGQNIVKDTIKVSPDSSMVAFITIDDRKNRTVQVMDMNKAMVMICDDSYMAVWSRDSKKLYYATFDQKNRRIAEYDVTGRTSKDVVKIEFKPGEESTGIKSLHFTDKLK